MADILIIGGGVAGLSAGIYAQLCGYSAAIYEAHGVAGGNLTGWQRGEYHIDNCIHWLTGTNPATKTYEMWEELGVLGGVEIFTPESLYTCRFGGQALSLYSDINKFEAEMLTLSPRDEKEIRALFCAVRLLQGAMGIAGDRQSNGLSAKDILMLPALVKYYGMSAKQLAMRFSHPLLRAFICAFWGDEFGALAMLSVFANFCGGNGGLPRGGSKAAADRMVARFLSLGGRLNLGKRVEKIELSGRRATAVGFSDGTRAVADYIIVTPDPAAVFGKILDLPMPRSLRRQYGNARAVRFSSLQCAISCQADFLPFGGDCIFDTDGGEQVIVREFSHEPSFAPTGETMLQTMSFCSEREAKRSIRLRRLNRAEYDRQKQQLGHSQICALEKEFPQLKGCFKLIDVWTPATYHRFVGSETGSYMGFTFPARALPKKLSGKVSGAENLLLATQWQQSPGGLPIAAERGRQAILEVCKKEHAYGRMPLVLEV
ncbi:MAG: NAD(P)/FAD-dependent oxidoreductase [Ruminococcaceae bacterium]|nr:NAD(P)/FAD-dependent oxidoreductase [Oscillospiraceae bacterium]